jgi:hypothetical protein
MIRGEVCLVLVLRDSDHSNVTFEHDKDEELLLIVTLIHFNS